MKRVLPTSLRLAVYIAIAVTACAGSPKPATETVCHELRLPHLESRTVLPLSPYLGKLRTVQVTIGGRHYPFLFDTGGGDTFISPELTAELGCTPTGRVVGHRQHGQRLDYRMCRDVDLTLGALTYAHQEVGVFDLMALLPPKLPKLYGVISMKLFEEQAVTIDLAKGELTVESRASLARRTADMRAVPMRIARPSAGQDLDVFIGLSHQTAPLWFLLDTGNLDHVIIAPHCADLLHLDYRQEGKYTRMPENAPYPERWDLAAVRLPLQPAPAAAEAAIPAVVQEIIYDGNLGAKFIERYLVTIDLATQRLWLKSQPARSP